MPRLYEKPVLVGPESIDALGHVNNREYLRWMEEAALEHSAAQGWSTERYLAAGGAWVAAEHRIEYLRPAFAGESLVVCTWVESLTGSDSLRRYVISRGRKPVARGETRWTFVNLASGRAIAVPEEVAHAFERVPEADPELVAAGLARRRGSLRV